MEVDSIKPDETLDALRDYVTMGNFKYPMYTDKIYV